ncbi:unnamed protein product [Calypogeia fissa]
MFGVDEDWLKPNKDYFPEDEEAFDGNSEENKLGGGSRVHHARGSNRKEQDSGPSTWHGRDAPKHHSDAPRHQAAYTASWQAPAQPTSPPWQAQMTAPPYFGQPSPAPWQLPPPDSYTPRSNYGPNAAHPYHQGPYNDQPYNALDVGREKYMAGSYGQSGWAPGEGSRGDKSGKRPDLPPTGRDSSSATQRVVKAHNYTCT